MENVNGKGDEFWMGEALAIANEGLAAGELPIGAVVVLDEEIVGRAHTEEVGQGRLLVHADLLALDQADRRLGSRRHEARLYVNLEPCVGCLGAAMTVMVSTIVFGLESPSDGAVGFARHWDRERDQDAFPAYRVPEIRGGVLREATIDLFKSYVDSKPSGDPLTVWAQTLAGR
jgi:tRNA(adenine34) deaminase